MEYAEHWFEGAFAGRDEALSVEDAIGSLGAGELAGRARSVAGAIAGNRPRVVGLALEPGCDWVVALHAAWLCGAAALPIDPKSDSGNPGEAHRPLRPGARAASRGAAGLRAVRHRPVLSGGDSLHLRHHGRADRGDAQPLEPDCPGSRQPSPARGRGDGPLAEFASPTHTGGLTVPVRCAVWAATAVIHERFETDRFLEMLAGESAAITVVSLVPLMLERMLEAGLENPPTLRTGSCQWRPLEPGLNGGRSTSASRSSKRGE